MSRSAAAHLVWTQREPPSHGPCRQFTPAAWNSTRQTAVPLAKTTMRLAELRDEAPRQPCQPSRLSVYIHVHIHAPRRVEHVPVHTIYTAPSMLLSKPPPPSSLSSSGMMHSRPRISSRQQSHRAYPWPWLSVPDPRSAAAPRGHGRFRCLDNTDHDGAKGSLLSLAAPKPIYRLVFRQMRMT